MSADPDSSKFYTVIAQEGLNACKLAAAGGHEGLVRLLLQSGADVNAADEVTRRHLASQTQRQQLTLLPIPSPVLLRGAVQPYGNKGCLINVCILVLLKKKFFNLTTIIPCILQSGTATSFHVLVKLEGLI